MTDEQIAALGPAFAEELRRDDGVFECSLLQKQWNRGDLTGFTAGGDLAQALTRCNAPSDMPLS
jgi:hypothetical protein